MKALIVSDKIIPWIYSPMVRERFAHVDVVFSCGDLPYYYLEYLISALDKPLYFVRGNHANLVEHGAGGARSKPWGAVDLHCRTANVDGLLVAGFEGSMRYNSGPFQYTDREMYWNVLRLLPALLWNRSVHGRFLDVLVTHSPPLGVGDDKDRCHTGFRAFRWFLQWARPRWMLHGHIHVYHPSTITRSRFARTEVLNCYGYREVELIPGAVLAAARERQETIDDRTANPDRLRSRDPQGVLESDKKLDHRPQQ